MTPRKVTRKKKAKPGPRWVQIEPCHYHYVDGDITVGCAMLEAYHAEGSTEEMPLIMTRITMRGDIPLHAQQEIQDALSQSMNELGMTHVTSGPANPEVN